MNWPHRPKAYSIDGETLVCNERQTINYYRLGDYPGLFRAFATIESPGDVLAFANRFGSLVSASREGLSFWRTEIAVTRQMLDMRDAERNIALWSEVAPGVWQSDLSRPFSVRAENPTAAAKKFLALQVDHFLESVSCNLSRGGDRSRPGLRASSLREVMQLQFAAMVLGHSELKSCRGCPGWFDARVHDGRKEFCSASCKTGHHTRRGKVRTLSESGKSVRSIASELRMDADAVRKFLAESA